MTVLLSWCAFRVATTHGEAVTRTTVPRGDFVLVTPRCSTKVEVYLVSESGLEVFAGYASNAAFAGRQDLLAAFDQHRRALAELTPGLVGEEPLSLAEGRWTRLAGWAR